MIVTASVALRKSITTLNQGQSSGKVTVHLNKQLTYVKKTEINFYYSQLTNRFQNLAIYEKKQFFENKSLYMYEMTTSSLINFNMN